MLTRSFLVKEAKLSIGLIKMDVIFFCCFHVNFISILRKKTPCTPRKKWILRQKLINGQLIKIKC